MSINGEKIIERYKPEVNEVSEMYEIASNFGNPLEFLREGISNAYDAEAKTLHIDTFINERNQLVIKLIDDGLGISKKTIIKNFWGLGYTDKVKGSAQSIGEKSHGTLIFFRSEKVILETYHSSGAYRSVAEKPLKKLQQGELFDFSVEEIPNNEGKTGTVITLIGFNQNVTENFKHEVMKDYMYWFTKLGSPQNELSHLGYTSKNFRVHLKGIDFKDAGLFSKYEECEFGHIFPDVTSDLRRLIKEKRETFHKYYVKKWVGIEKVSIIDENNNEREIEYEYIIYIEGDTAKRQTNKALKPSGKKGENNLYRVADRYGVYIAKDFIPLQKITEWLPRMGHSSTTTTTFLHGFINCQSIHLTSDRSSMASTEPLLELRLRKSIENLMRRIDKELKQEPDGMYYIKKNLKAILKEIDDEEGQSNLPVPIDNPTPGEDDILPTDGDETPIDVDVPPFGGQDEPNDGNKDPVDTNPNPDDGDEEKSPVDVDKELYDNRVNRILNKRYYELIGENNLSIGVNKRYSSTFTRKIYEPFNEAETYGVFMQLYGLFTDLFPFTVLDYSSHRGIDLLVSFDKTVKNPSISERMFYLELKHTFYGKNFNHAFHNLAYIVCWDIDNRIVPNSIVKNMAGEEAFYRVEKTSDEISYYLMQRDNPIKIQIIPLKRIIEEKLGIQFKR
ncbi:ATP-binding protein [Bacillus atrophaeus]|uniref:ATP-binding protein n=1 Tax=Bacillus atrophaeus TaxID=1452 RepID=UPI00227FAAE2|nr:ATP-binding protein [Bacillus atrophaeus]MCY8519109.1 ATP-binding protein [Bacillus atrophaeus]